MNLLDALFLAVVQGLTEFLPISSSGHLVLAKAILRVQSPGAVWEVALHVGTLLAVFTVFCREILCVITGLIRGVSRVFGADGWKKTWADDGDFRMACYLVVGSIPAGCAGLFLKPFIDGLFSNLTLALIMLFVTGELLWLTRSQRLYRPSGKLRLTDAIVIGIVQAFALLPGISRSGSTICFALFRGVETQRAARFSFLLAAPAILGGALLDAGQITALPKNEISLLLAGVVASALVGYAALRLLLGLVATGKLYWFAWYCWGVAVAGLAWLWSSGSL